MKLSLDQIPGETWHSVFSRKDHNQHEELPYFRVTKHTLLVSAAASCGSPLANIIPSQTTNLHSHSCRLPWQQVKFTSYCGKRLSKVLCSSEMGLQFQEDSFDTQFTDSSDKNSILYTGLALFRKCHFLNQSYRSCFLQLHLPDPAFACARMFTYTCKQYYTNLSASKYKSH